MGDMVQVVWFKRDLRIHDHRALAYASAHGPVLPIYVAEPDLWCEPDMSARQWNFISESLTELRDALAGRGQPLVVRKGEMIAVLDALMKDHKISALWSHQETGNDWTYKRDRRVAAWCAAYGVMWHEIQNHGVQRRLASRNGWAARWDRLMAEPVAPAPYLKPKHKKAERYRLHLTFG